jgi:DNA/RNA-binding domain of Phe-tRNA-synthetase-like protein
MQINLRLNDPEFLAGVVIAHPIQVAPADPELSRRLDELLARRSQEAFPPPPLKEAVREMLRRGGFRPAGRNKPASEYLAQAAREGRFPRINNLVDALNLLSLESGLPISLLDLEALGDQVEIRYGQAGEKYVFNAAGQEIDLKGLICVCRMEGDASKPLGTPIKDSMAGKIKDHTRGVMGILYGSTQAADESTMAGYLAEFAQLLKAHGGAPAVEHRLLRMRGTES